MGWVWDGESTFATLDGELLPGRPHRNDYGWAIELPFETGALLYVTGHDREDATSTGFAVLLTPLPDPGRTSGRFRDGVVVNAAPAWLRTVDGVDVTEGVAGTLEAVVFDAECRGWAHCEACYHDAGMWSDVIPNIDALRRVIDRIHSLPVLPSRSRSSMGIRGASPAGAG